MTIKNVLKLFSVNLGLEPAILYPREYFYLGLHISSISILRYDSICSIYLFSIYYLITTLSRLLLLSSFLILSVV